MSDIEETRGHLAGGGRRFGIVASRFNQRIGEALIAGAVDCLRRHGVAAEDVHLVTVPGAWEIPQALNALVAAGPRPSLAAGSSRSTPSPRPTAVAAAPVARAVQEAGSAAPPAGGASRFDALIALGVVIRGETPHFDVLVRECTAGIARAGERCGLPVAYGVLTCDTSEQAAERAGGKAGNKGWEAAMAALEMADLFARLDAGSSRDSSDSRGFRDSRDSRDSKGLPGSHGSAGALASDPAVTSDAAGSAHVEGAGGTAGARAARAGAERTARPPRQLRQTRQPRQVPPASVRV
jgi:6,7-dimethyl-8-ribityllumazine synthase